MPPRAIKHQLTCPFELNSDSFLIGRRHILVIPRNHLVGESPGFNIILSTIVWKSDFCVWQDTDMVFTSEIQFLLWVVTIPGDSGQTPALSICSKFAGPTIRITRHLLRSLLEWRIQRTRRKNNNGSQWILEFVLYIDCSVFSCI